MTESNRQLRIGVNALATTSYRGGSATYLVNLIKAISAIDKRNIYYIFTSPLNSGLFDGLGANIVKVVMPLKRDNYFLRILLEQLFIPLSIKKLKIDLLFSPNNIATIFPGCKQVLTMQLPLLIKSVRKLYAPDEIGWFKKIFFDFILPISLKRSNCVIAVSEDIKKRILGEYPVSRNKIEVIHEGVDLELFKNGGRAGPLQNIEKPYILFVSTFYKYKNADKLMMAFAKAKEKYNIRHKLVYIGGDYCGQLGQLNTLAEELKVKEAVAFLGPVKHKEIGEYYRSADIFVYPSSVETFGLPVLEAMACGVPVIASNRMSIPEIAGDAGVIVDPDNVDYLSEALYKIATDKILRQMLIAKGHKRVKQFSWNKVAEETLSVFEKCIAE
jgi:glycosyltransferase involved in cell wall biosynthesis